MTEKTERFSGLRTSGWRIAVWGAAALLLALPLVAMQFTKEVNWELADFVVFGTMLAAVCGTYELAARATADYAYRAAVGVALLTAFILVWVNLAVGIIGNENNPANLVYVGVLAVGIVGAIIARFKPYGMARALFATALAQALVGVIVLFSGAEPRIGLFVGHGFLTALWVGSAWLFLKTGRSKTDHG